MLHTALRACQIGLDSGKLCRELIHMFLLVCLRVFDMSRSFLTFSLLIRELSGPLRDTPPPFAQYPFEIVSQRGVSHAFCLVFKGYRASIAEIPILRGASHLQFSCSPRGNAEKKAEGVSHPIGHV